MISPERSPRFCAIAVMLFGLAVLFFLLPPHTSGADEAARTAPTFRLRDTHRSEVALPGFTDKVILLNFWATWCASCGEQPPELGRLYRAYRDRGFIDIGISVDTSAEQVAAFLEKRPVGFPVATDTQGTVAEAFVGTYGGTVVTRDEALAVAREALAKEVR